ncbi:MAG TPA: hypothetical protein P5250_06735 [Bacteroidales bacterium]|nr:hypothetical protein [Bacteroidales bacterium]
MKEVIIVILYALLFLLVINKIKFFNLPGIGNKPITGVFILKIICGIAVWATYTWYYKERNTADIFKYFDDSKVMYDAAFNRPIDFLQMITGIDNNNEYFNHNYYNKMNNWFRVHESTLYNESHSLIRFNALIRFFSFGYFNVHTVFMCFFSLVGLTGLYRFLYKYLRRNKIMLFCIVFLLPTVLFWGSGVLKEGLILTGLGLLLWSYDKVINKNFDYRILIIMLLSFLLIRYTKVYIALALLPLMMTLIWVKYESFKRVFIKFFIGIIVFNILLFIISYKLLGINVFEELARKQRDFIGLAHSVNSGSLLNVRILEPSVWSLIINIPQALYNVCCRPWFFESKSLLMLITSIENLASIIIAIFAIFFYKKPDKRLMTIVFFSLFFVLQIYILTGLTTPVMGAFVRYKLPAFPFLFLMLLSLIDGNKLFLKLRALKIIK